MEKIQTLPVTYNFLRQNAALIDRKSIFLDLESAKKYAETDPTKYVGQIITVVNTENTENPVQIYKIINNEGKLDDLQNSTIKIWKKVPPSTRFKVKVPANNNSFFRIDTVLPCENETVTIDWGDDTITDSSKIINFTEHQYKNTEEKEFIISISDNAKKIKIILDNNFNSFNTNLNPIQVFSFGNKVEDVSKIFWRCSELKETVSFGLNTNLANCAYADCLSLKEAVSLGPEVLKASGAYQYCEKLSAACELGPKVYNASYAFRNCPNLEIASTLGPEVLEAQFAYQNCKKLSAACELGPKVNNASNAFIGCPNLEIASTLGPEVVDVKQAYYYCPRINKIKFFDSTKKEWITKPISEVTHKEAFGEKATNYQYAFDPKIWGAFKK